MSGCTQYLARALPKAGANKINHPSPPMRLTSESNYQVWRLFRLHFVPGALRVVHSNRIRMRGDNSV